VGRLLCHGGLLLCHGVGQLLHIMCHGGLLLCHGMGRLLCHGRLLLCAMVWGICCTSCAWGGLLCCGCCCAMVWRICCTSCACSGLLLPHVVQQDFSFEKTPAQSSYCPAQYFSTIQLGIIGVQKTKPQTKKPISLFFYYFPLLLCHGVGHLLHIMCLQWAVLPHAVQQDFSFEKTPTQSSYCPAQYFSTIQLGILGDQKNKPRPKILNF